MSPVGRAGTITFNYAGTVTQVPIDDFGLGIQPGDSFTGSFTFDSTAPDQIASPLSGSYNSNGLSFGMSATIGLLTFSNTGMLNIGTINSFVDQYTVLSSADILTLNLFFQDNSAAIFSNDSLPLSPPTLAGFQQRDFHLDQNDGENETQVDGTITSLTCGSGCTASAVPEPSTAALLFVGSVLLAYRRVRKSKNWRRL
jgi:hypothetical protein